jgi:thiamine-monophosphate kinase
LGEDTGAFNCPLLGGDTVSTPGPLMVSITAFGRVAPGKMVHRSGAKPGDHVLVTGTIGDAALGLDILRKGSVATALANDAVLRDMLVGRYRVPEPRNALASAIRAHAHAAMDVSDGLAGDLAKLCAASAVSAAIELAAIPLSKAASAALTAGAVTLSEIVSGGDDYEILCTVAPDVLEPFVQAANASGIAANRIGTIVAGKAAPKFLDTKGAELALTRTSFSHF